MVLQVLHAKDHFRKLHMQALIPFSKVFKGDLCRHYLTPGCIHCPALPSTNLLQHMATGGCHADSFDLKHELLTISVTLSWL